MTNATKNTLLTTAFTGLLLGLSACGGDGGEVDPNAGMPAAATEQEASATKAGCAGKDGCPGAKEATTQADKAEGDEEPAKKEGEAKKDGEAAGTDS